MNARRSLTSSRILLAALPLTVCMLWSSWPAAKAVVAAVAFRADADDVHKTGETPVIIRRKVQKHFLAFDVYVPPTDILIAAETPDPQDSLEFLMRKMCGSGKIHIWLPLRFRFPIMGEKILEWCMTQ